MNRLDMAKRTQILGLLVEGSSLRAASRIADVSINTVTKLLVEVGAACREYQDKHFMNLPCEKIQCDEIWSFCYAKEKNVPEKFKMRYGFGDIYTFVALCPDCKLVPTYLVGRRDIYSANIFMRSLERRINHRVQLTTDGYAGYRDAVINNFGEKADYAQLVKSYGHERKDAEIRYSPPEVISTKKVTVIGNPDPDEVSTSLVERQNLTMRMGMRRFTRLTNAFSKKIDNLRAAVALHFMYYNFCRIHQSIRSTPAMRAKITDHVWSLEEVARLADAN